MIRIVALNQTVVLLVGLLVVLTLAEMWFSYRENRHYYEKRDTFTNVYLTFLAFLLGLATNGSGLLVLSFAYRFRFFSQSQSFFYWVALVIFQDFLYWVLHYIGHVCRIFWAMHVTHHSSEHFNLSTGFRSTVFEPLYRSFIYLPLPLLGFHPADILYAYLLTQLYGSLVHTQYKIKLPKWYDFVFVTPAHHRVHHGSNVRYLDKNMGMMFILWDRLFGTFQDEDPAEPVKYGLVKQPAHLGPVNVLFHEWKALIKDAQKAPGLKNKILYFIMPPGWSHDGSTKTARTLQQEQLTQRFEETEPTQNLSFGK